MVSQFELHQSVRNQAQESSLWFHYIDGRAQRSCVTPVAAVQGKQVTTIEGLGQDGLHPVQQAWLAEDVPQCCVVYVREDGAHRLILPTPLP